MDHDQTLEVAVRFHDIRRLHELDRAIFSLITQSYRPLRILLALQRFTPKEVNAVTEALAVYQTIDGAPELKVLNLTEPEPPDARSGLINLAFQNAKGRYLACLDYDDLIHPEAYELLIGQLRSADAAIAFGGIYISHVDVFDDFLRIESKSYPFNGSNVIDLFRGNFCPIHSFVLDRSRISKQHLYFEPLMNKNEDYDFLLRICAQYPSDFSLIKTYVGTYYLKTDGSNTILTASASTPANIAAWQYAEAFVDARRKTAPVSTEVQRMLGLVPDATLTIHALLGRPPLLDQGRNRS